MSVAARVLSDRTRPDADPRVFVTGSNPSSLSMPIEGVDVVAIERVVTNREPSAERRRTTHRRVSAPLIRRNRPVCRR